ncbi:MAG TPA: DUF58 domain-containing protein [bacterium]|nr:DUF58 domain-containing protein [bacterium]HQL63316.1 DUF58 domain-containing protein [bacterium]
MIPRDLIKKIRRIEIRTNRLVNDVLAGEYHSVFKGRGMEFEEVREYQLGDDVRSIDWNVTARMGHPFVKRFREERELTVMLAVDVSSSGAFGTAEQMKADLGVELSAVLAFSAIKNNDCVGLIEFTNRIEKFIPPKKGKKHVLRLIRELLYARPEGSGTDLRMALEFLGRVLHRRSVVFVISDFLGSDYEDPLRIINQKHDLITIGITDPRELELPPVGFLELQDAETGEVVLIDTYDWDLRRRFAERNASMQNDLQRSFRRLQVDHIPVRTDQPYIDPLVQFFNKRASRL